MCPRKSVRPSDNQNLFEGEEDFTGHRSRPVARDKDGAHASGDLITAHVDGGARGNPGPAGFGAYITDARGKTLAELSEYLGHKTNNFAEYSGLLAALEFAIKNGHNSLQVVSDSELMVKQMTGVYKVRSPELKELYDRARMMTRKLEYFKISHVLRAKNKDADRLANEAMDRGMGRGSS